MDSKQIMSVSGFLLHTGLPLELKIDRDPWRLVQKDVGLEGTKSVVFHIEFAIEPITAPEKCDPIHVGIFASHGSFGNIQLGLPNWNLLDVSDNYFAG